MAQVALARGELAAAERWYSEAAQFSASNPDALMGLANVYQVRGELAQAEDLLRRLVPPGRTHNGMVPVLNRLAEMELSKSNHAAAETDLKRAIDYVAEIHGGQPRAQSKGFASRPSGAATRGHSNRHYSIRGSTGGNREKGFRHGCACATCWTRKPTCSGRTRISLLRRLLIVARSTSALRLAPQTSVGSTLPSRPRDDDESGGKSGGSREGILGCCRGARGANGSRRARRVITLGRCRQVGSCLRGLHRPASRCGP